MTGKRHSQLHQLKSGPLYWAPFCKEGRGIAYLKQRKTRKKCIRPTTLMKAQNCSLQSFRCWALMTINTLACLPLREVFSDHHQPSKSEPLTFFSLRNLLSDRRSSSAFFTFNIVASIICLYLLMNTVSSLHKLCVG